MRPQGNGLVGRVRLRLAALGAPKGLFTLMNQLNQIDTFHFPHFPHFPRFP